MKKFDFTNSIGTATNTFDSILNMTIPGAALSLFNLSAQNFSRSTQLFCPLC